MRVPTRWAPLLSSCVALAGCATFELPESPAAARFTALGCDILESWTVPYVQDVIGANATVMRRMQSRFGLDPQRICVLDPKEVRRLAKLAALPGPEFDQPDKAIEYRLLSYLDDSGTPRPDGLIRALEHRKRVVRDTLLLRSMMDAGITSASWTGLGPTQVGGRMRAIAVHPTIPGRILVGSVSGGIWKSTDSAASFTPINDFASSLAIACLVHDPVNPSTVYACTGEGMFNTDAIRGFGIFKSSDNGDTWSVMPGTDPTLAAGPANPRPQAFYYVNRLAVHPTAPSIMLAATNDGVLRTTDGGATWAVVYDTPGCSGGRRVNDVRFDPANGNYAVLGEGSLGLCGVNGGAVAWSADAGATWTRVPFAGGGRVELAHAPSSVSGGRTMTWYASVDATSGQIWKSTNGGQTWTQVSSFGHLSNQGWYDNALWVAPNDANRILAGGVFLYMSTNGGASMQLVCTHHPDHHVIVTHPDYATTGKVYMGSDGGLSVNSAIHTSIVSAPPGSLYPNSCVTPPEGFIPATNMNNGLAITQFYGGAGGAVPAARLAGGTQDNGSFVYRFGDDTWKRVWGSDGARSAVDPTDSNYSYGAMQNGAIHRNSDGGATQSIAICAGISEVSCSGGAADTNFITPIALDPNNPNRLYVGAASLWRSENAKLAATPSWTIVKPRASFAGLINYIAVAPGNSDLVWVGHNNGQLYRTVNATAASPTWTEVASPAGRQVQKILIDKDDPSRVFVTFGGFVGPNVFVSTNASSPAPTWSPRHGNLPQAPVRALARHPSNPQWLYAGTEVGVFTSQDGGNRWSATNDGPGTVSVEELFFLTPSKLIAATHGRGLFEASVHAEPPLPVARRPRDMNGDGKSDILIRDGTNGVVYGWLMNGVAIASGAYVLSPSSGWTPVRTLDLNGDGKADLLIQHTDGSLYAWIMDGLTVTGGGYLLGAGTGWSVSHVGDFNGDGKADILLEHTNGSIYIWLMDGFTIANGTYLQGAGTGWMATHVADFNGDGKSDVLLEHIDGSIYVWQMNGIAIQTGAFLKGAGIDWSPTETGDFNGDGKADILITHTNGGVYLWQMNGIAIQTGAYLLSPASGWSIAKTGDLDGDGKTDIIIKHTDGSHYAWMMDGLNVTGGGYLLGASTGWSVSHLLDLNGDGKSDILLKHTDGSIYAWIMNGATIANGAYLMGVGNWRVTP